MVGALLVGLPLPVTAVQILWINLVTDTALVIPLGLEPPEDDHMKRAPRPANAPILDRLILARIILVGLVMAGLTLAIFWYFERSGYSLAYAQSVAFMALVAAQWMNAFNARSERFSLLERLKIQNPKMLLGLALAVSAQVLVMLGPLKEVFKVSSLELPHLLLSIFLPVITIFLIVEIHKLSTRKRITN